MKFLSILGFVAPKHGQPDYSGAFDAPPVVSWRVPLPGPSFPAATHTELAAPLVVGDMVMVGSAASPGLFMLHRGSGDLVRTIDSPAPVQAAPVVVDDKLVFGDAGGTTIVTTLDGQELWRHSSGAPILATPSVQDGVVYVTNVDDVVLALDLASGDLVWRHAQRLDPGRVVDLELYSAPQPRVWGDLVLTGHSDGTLAALSRDTGEQVWQRRVGEGRYPDISAAVVVHDGHGIIGGYSEPLISVDLDSQVVRWRLAVGTADEPIVEGDKLYHPGADGILRCIDPTTGDSFWEWDSEFGGALSTPTVTEAGILIGSSVEGLVLVDPQTGVELWRLEPGYVVSGLTAPVAVEGRQAVVLTNAGFVMSLVSPSPRIVTEATSVFAGVD